MSSTLESSAKQEQTSKQEPTCKQEPTQSYKGYHKPCRFFIDSDKWDVVERLDWHNTDPVKWNEVIFKREAGEDTGDEEEAAKGTEPPKLIGTKTIEAADVKELTLENCFICRIYKAINAIVPDEAWIFESCYCPWPEILKECVKGGYAKPISDDEALSIWPDLGGEGSETRSVAGVTE